MIILYIEQANDYFGKSLLDGFVKESKSHSWWTTISVPLSDKIDTDIIDLCSQVDGFVTRGAPIKLKNIITESNKPHIVLRSPTSNKTQWPLHVNDVEIGQIAHNETKRLNIANQAFLGFKNVIWSKERNKAFAADDQNINELLITYGLHQTASGLQEIANWLMSLPKPTSLFAASDSLGSAAISACLLNNIKVPEEVAIIGADNDQHTCEITNPSLSSIDLHPESIGRACAWALAKEIGIIASLRSAPTVIPPSLVVRESSHSTNSNSKLYKKAITWINENALYGPSVQEVADYCNTSKRTLERAFLDINNCTPATYIRNQRLQGILYLLGKKELSLNQLSQISNFPDSSSFSNFIKRKTGKTPRELRKEISTITN